MAYGNTNEEFLRPSRYPKGTGSRTTTVGPPTAGTWAADEIWVDANRAVWRCTVAGTPGTWVQVQGATAANGAPLFNAWNFS